MRQSRVAQEVGSLVLRLRGSQSREPRVGPNPFCYHHQKSTLKGAFPMAQEVGFEPTYPVR